MNKQCQNCKTNFSIENEDLEFYSKIKVPTPTWCPECHLIRRMLWRNERALYRRPCSKCGKEKITMYPSESPYTVYCLDCWWGDTWNGDEFGREYSFQKTFFEQFRDLLRTVPRPSTIQQQNVRCDYVNRVSQSKDCYLIFGANYNENCFYGTQINNCKDSMDSFNLQLSELCYGCTDCSGSYRLLYSKDCISCTNSELLTDCRNCDSCFGCVNLRNKKHCVYNEQLTKEEYENKVSEMNMHTREGVISAKQGADEAALKGIFPNIISKACEHVSGNWLDGVRGGYNCYACRSIENGKNLFSVIEAKDVQDFTYWGRGSELVYDTISVGMQCSNIRFCNELWNGVVDAQYCMNCPGSSHIFGCIGVKKKEYCILNKQYTKEEFESLVPKIIDHMNEHPYKDALGRVYPYGEFLPPELSLFGYNETMAQEYFALSDSEAKSKGFRWATPEKKSHNVTIEVGTVPNDIELVEESITKETIRCAHAKEGIVSCNEQCASAFRITPKELEFYKKLNIPLPTICHNCRHFERLSRRNPIHLWGRGCCCPAEKRYTNTAAHFHAPESCPNEFQTTYAPEKPETVYCETCYQSEVA